MVLEMLAFVPGLLLLALANYTEKRKELGILTQVFLALCVMLVILEGAMSVAMADSLTGIKSPKAYGYGIMITGVLSLLLFLEPVRGVLARIISIDRKNWLHATALIFAVLLVGMSLSTALATDIVELSKATGIDSASVILQDVFFVFAALLGVGWLTRKRLREALVRLGLVRPKLRDIGLSLAFLLMLLLVVIAIGEIAILFGLASDSLGLEDDPTIEMLGGVTLLAGIVLAVGAGVGEELVFRGAMQPRFGIILTSLIFASIHTQYLNLISMLSLFFVSLCLGYERKLAGTAVCIITHACYNGLLFTIVALGV